MATLIISYGAVFIYLRFQSRKLKSMTQDETGEHNSSWHAEVQAGGDSADSSDVPISSSKAFTTRTLSITANQRPQKSRATKVQRRMRHASLALLCYPIVYIFLTMTLSIARISEFAGKPWSLQKVYVGACIYECSGFVNVLLYTGTRKGIISWDWIFRKLKRKHKQDRSQISSTDRSEESKENSSGSVTEVKMDFDKGI